jgi:glutaredoxin-like YruB-family protein
MSVIVYTTPACGYCKRAKEYFAEKGIQYEEVDVSRDRAKAIEMVEKSGQMGVPVLEVNGKILVGFDPVAIDSALAG